MNRTAIKRIAAGVMAMLLSLPMTACGNGENNNTAASTTAVQREYYTTLSDLNGKRIGMQPGTNMDQTVLTKLSGVQFKNYSTYSDMIAALRNNAIDAFPADEPVIMELVASNPDLHMIEEYLETFDLGYAFPKTPEGDKLNAEMSAYLKQLSADGTLAKLMVKWTGNDESEKKISEDLMDLPATNGTLSFVTEGDYEPFNYFKDGKVTGYDVEIAAMFCKEKGYGLSINTLEFSKIIDAIAAGDYDFAGAGITITDQRKEKVNFSEPNYSGGVTMCVMAQ